MRAFHRFRIASLCGALTLAASPSSAAVLNVLTNGSFEGPGGWLTGTSPGSPGGTQCSFNIAAPAPGTETATATAGYAAIDGANVALGSVSATSASLADCVFYQDVAIPAGATTATLTSSIAYKLNGGKTNNNVGVTMGLYPTTTIPGYLSAPSVTRFYQAGGTGTASAVLTTSTSAAINVSTLAGTTVRFSYILSSTSVAGSAVAGLDNFILNVEYTPPVVATPSAVPSLSEWSTLLLTGVVAAMGTLFLRRRRVH